MNESAPLGHNRNSVDELEAHWLPFTPNRRFKQKPKLFVAAQGMHYVEAGGRRVLDGMAGLWCVNAGHAREPIIEAIARQARQLDYVSSFQMGHPHAFELAQRIADLAPDTLNHVFFTNSGSEAVDTALKIARAYHRARGETARLRFIGRARAYHGVGWGGLSVGGIGRQRKDFGPLLGDVSHLGHTLDLEHNAFSRGQPAWGAHLADELLQMVQIYDPSTIAAVILEPVIGSGGVLPPPKGYLERLRQICDQHGILLICDEVITGFGRLGTAFASQAFGIRPDMITCAKGMTNGAIPMGGVIVGDGVYDAFMQGPEAAIEFMHGYTYSGHPIACAASLATLDIYRDEALFARAGKLATVWEEAAHALKGAPHIVDIRTIGMLGGIDLAPRSDAPGARGIAVADHCFDHGILIRSSGDTLVLSPPLIISEDQIAQTFDAIRAALGAIA